MFIVERLREEGATVEICGKVSCTFISPDCIQTFSIKIYTLGMYVNKPSDNIQKQTIKVALCC